MELLCIVLVLCISLAGHVALTAYLLHLERLRKSDHVECFRLIANESQKLANRIGDATSTEDGHYAVLSNNLKTLEDKVYGRREARPRTLGDVRRAAETESGNG